MQNRILVSFVLYVCLPGLSAEAPSSVERAFTLDHNRMVVNVDLVRPDGSLRKARAWVDTGADTLNLAESLARELGLEIPSFPHASRSAPSPSKAPILAIGGIRLDTAEIQVQVQPGKVVRAGVQAELNLPARVFRKQHVIFDYPARRLILAAPGALKPQGTPIPCRIHPETCLFQIQVSIEGVMVQLAVDNGSAGTWVAEPLAQSWISRHPEWPTVRGAAGSANFFGFPFEAKGLLLRLPEIQIGPYLVQSVALLGLDQGIINWYSTKTAEPVQGFIGANVLTGFRLEIDFPQGMTYWTPTKTIPESLDRVGLTLRPLPDGRTMIAGVLEQGGKTCAEGVAAGDILVRVDGLDIATLSMGAVMEALSGKPGTVKTLQLERKGKTVFARAKVLHLI